MISCKLRARNMRLFEVCEIASSAVADPYDNDDSRVMAAPRWHAE